jgi:hypothetical protein
LVGELPGYGTVWYDPQAIANILSLKNIKQKYHVTYNSNDEDSSFCVKKADGKTFLFKESERGLYYIDTVNNVHQDGVLMVNTVSNKKDNYTNEDYQQAVKARELQIKIGRPSYKDFIRIITERMLPNCPIKKADVVAAEDIFGPDVGSLKGKTTRSKPHQVREVVEVLPTETMKRYRMVTLCIDVMYVNKIPMLVSLSRDIKFGAVEDIPNRTSAVLLNGIRKIIKLYKRAGFQVVAALMDGEFEVLRGELSDLGVALNVAAPDEHVGDIERYIRTIKERMRAMYNTLPFERVPHRMIIEMAKSSVFWLNAFPNTRGVSHTLSPRTIVTGQTVDFNRHCTHQFGEYVQTHEEHNNSMASRTIGALAMRPTGNAQGSFYYFSLSTGRIINRRHATKLPMPEDVIDRVHLLARRQNSNIGLLFTDRNDENNQYDDVMLEEHDMSDDDADYIPDNDNDTNSDSDDENDDDISEHIDDVDFEQQEAIADDIIDHRDEIAGVQRQIAGVQENIDEIAGVQENMGMIPQANDVGDELDRDNVDVEEDWDHHDGVQNDDHNGGAEAGPDVQAEMDDLYGPRSERYNLQPRRERDYGHLFSTDGTPLSTPQMSMSKGVAMFGEDGISAVKKELQQLQQLHERKVMIGRNHYELTRDQKKGFTGLPYVSEAQTMWKSKG